jgi:hypothetical protein
MGFNSGLKGLKKARLKIKTYRIVRVPEVFMGVSWFPKLMEGRMKDFENGLQTRIL